MGEQRDKMLAGEWYICNDPDLHDDLDRAAELSGLFNTSVPGRDGEMRRREILEELFSEYGEDTEFRPPMHCDYGYQTTVGARTFANFGLVLLDVARISIGDDVQIGPNVQLLTAIHPIDPQPRRDKIEGGKPITIGDNVWLGGGVMVCPGVTIGENTIVGAGAVVTKDLPANVIAVGNPARVLREIVPGEEG